MRGIDTYKAEQNAKRYRAIYDDWKAAEETLAELGEKYDLTKQRVHQIIAYMKIGEGDYYKGRLEARQKRKELDKKEFKLWLKLKGLKVSVNNKKFSTYA